MRLLPIERLVGQVFDEYFLFSCRRHFLFRHHSPPCSWISAALTERPVTGRMRLVPPAGTSLLYLQRGSKQNWRFTPATLDSRLLGLKGGCLSRCPCRKPHPHGVDRQIG